MNRRILWGGPTVLALAAVGLVVTRTSAPAQGTEIVVYKEATCGCCGQWVEHIKAAGFHVTVRTKNDPGDIKDRYGITPALMSCHTAVVDGYAIEGHVPRDVIQRLLRERPAVAGLAVPGMPGGSPGMEGPIREHYNVLAFDRSGGTKIYASR